MKWKEAIARYIDYIDLLNFSSYTKRTRTAGLGQLARFLEKRDIHHVEQVTESHLMDFRNWLYQSVSMRGTVRAVTSQNHILADMKSFFAFLHQEEWTRHDPAKKLEYAREPKRLPRNILTPEEAKKILNATDLHTTLGYRDRTLLEVLYATGIRKNELISLHVEDLNLDEELLRINAGKGNKDRVVPLTRVAVKFLETYLHAIRPQLLFKRGASVSYLFLTHKGLPMGKDAPSLIVKKYAKQAGIKKPVTCHVWRHTCATHLVRNQANLRHVQAILGHGSLATTERYLHLTITDLKEAHRKHHPREKNS